MATRSREKILDNLEGIFREAYQRAKDADDQSRMMDLDSSYQREQLLLEVLLDIRDALAGTESTGSKALKRIKAIKDITKLR